MTRWLHVLYLVIVLGGIACFALIGLVQR